MQAIPEIVGADGHVYAITSGRTFSAGIASVAYLKQAAGDLVDPEWAARVVWLVGTGQVRPEEVLPRHEARERCKGRRGGVGFHLRLVAQGAVVSHQKVLMIQVIDRHHFHCFAWKQGFLYGRDHPGRKVHLGIDIAALHGESLLGCRSGRGPA
mgnify:CR=1 FL=1